MTTKFTILVEEETIKRAKKYSAQTGQSLSKIIENYLDSVTLPQQSKTKKFSPRIKRLMGSVKLPKDFDYKKIVEETVKEKFK
jgi:polyhydroxyalkanoate synthesis regulator phasin